SQCRFVSSLGLEQRCMTGKHIAVFIGDVIKVIDHLTINSFISISGTHCNYYSIYRRVFRQSRFINALAKHWSIIISIEYSDVDDYST
uniref:Uncharacterized protein n=1 Tax=Myripristis murdjan TaxID=586833 RepID=A0A667WTI0_9TELE